MSIKKRYQEQAGSKHKEEIAVEFPSLSIKGVLRRIFKTIEPHAAVPAVPYGPNICHGIVANAIISRGNDPELKIWLYGVKHPNASTVQHSVLSDENNHLVKDPWRSTEKIPHIWQRHEGWGKPGDMLDFLGVFTVGDLYDDFGV